MKAGCTCEVFWNRLLAISEATKAEHVSIDHVRDLLAGLDEGFGDVFDPADDFDEFVALDLCRSFHRLLETL